MAGRKRTPDHLKIVAGTAQPCRMNPDAPASVTGTMEAPAWLSARASELFDQLAVIIADMGIASVSDAAMLAMAASRLEEIEICTAMIEDGGRTFVSGVKYDDEGRIVSQQIKGHPAVAQRSEAMRHAQSLLAEFGLSPSARSKVSVSKPNEKNPFAALG
ncbi:P27 family predicted phage terminase small subunit [Pseudaminobacter salicylatoxidans]|uniref:P27 family predicted phage terminase small subunit n=1 Tax=Pseudaminobacter salicylatoxidans TaxID=93369 RepID=A0A316BU33_PSESE|nr:phage terminase small subunit P27 family [Pseudaminobacter salicylatoxidans]PWJ75276.1 P27 family predicted phage terminase small subunit [Pseudaminobacter salicylatoxidans]